MPRPRNLKTARTAFQFILPTSLQTVTQPVTQQIQTVPVTHAKRGPSRTHATLSSPRSLLPCEDFNDSSDQSSTQVVSVSNQNDLEARLGILEGVARNFETIDMRLGKLERHSQMETVRLDHLESMWSQLHDFCGERLLLEVARSSDIEAHVQKDMEALGASEEDGDAASMTSVESKMNQDCNVAELFDAHLQKHMEASGASEEAGDAAGMTSVASKIIKTSGTGDTELFERERDVDMYTLKESLWDALFLQLFHKHHKGIIDVVVTALLYIANVVAQVLMTYLVYTNMSNKAWITNNDLDNLLQWRISVSHGMAQYNQESNTSLASRVCTGEPSRILANDQSAMQEEIEEYLRNNRPFNGPVLLICALIIWLSLVGIELIKTIEFTFALFSIKRSTERNKGKWHDDGYFTIDSIEGNSRGFILWALVFPRLIIAAWLGTAGVLYLVNSSTMGDLIFNCMALGFILDIDELLYNYVPKRTVVKLSATRPISLERVSPFKQDFCMDLGRLLSSSVLLLIIPAVLAVWFFYVEALFGQLDKAQAILCGGKLNLVFATDKSNGVLSYATTSEAGHPMTAHYKTLGTMQATGLQNEPELVEYLQTWPQPDTVYAQRTSLEHLDTLNKQSQQEAASQQLCLDLDSDGPSRASLKAITGMVSCNETNPYDIRGRCTEPVVRRYCPVACLCNAVSWWYDRGGCPPSCEASYKKDLDAYLIKHMAVHEGCTDGDAEGIPDMAPHGGSFTEFAKYVERDLKRDGKVNEAGYLLGHWQTRLEKLSLNQCMFRGNPWLDLEELLLHDLNDSFRCTGMMLLDSLFDIGLCDIDFTRFRSGLGNMAAYCPDSCQVCPLTDYSLEPPRTIMDAIYMKKRRRIIFNRNVKPFLVCGYEWLFCGETRNGTTHGAGHHLGSFAQEKIYSFYAEPGKFYWFEVISLTKLSMKFKIYDFQLLFARQQILYDVSTKGRGHDEFLRRFASILRNNNTITLVNARFFDQGVHYIMVETEDVLETTDFQISMRTNESSCGHAVPLQIRCGEVVKSSLVDSFLRSGSADELDVFGYKYLERIFRFQVDAGVEYTFDSCGSSIPTELFLYDNYLRQPALLGPQDVSSDNCSDPSRGTFSWRFEFPGEYYVVVESEGGTRSGEILLSMHCK